MHGFGSYEDPSGSKYTGDWRDGRQHGQGVCETFDGEQYTGQYVDGLPCGKGVYKFKNGEFLNLAAAFPTIAPTFKFEFAENYFWHRKSVHIFKRTTLGNHRIRNRRRFFIFDIIYKGFSIFEL